MRPSALACAHNPLQNHSLFSCIPAFIYIYFAIISFSSALCVRCIMLLVLIAVCLDVCVLFFLSIVVSGDSPLFRKDYKIAPRNDIFDGFCPVTACVAQVYRCWCYARIRQHVNGMYTYSCFFFFVGSVWENCCQAVGISVRDIIICGIERKTTHCFRATVLRWGDTGRELVARVPAKNLLKFMDEKYYKIANTHSQSILHFFEYAIPSCLLLLFDVDCVLTAHSPSLSFSLGKIARAKRF